MSVSRRLVLAVALALAVDPAARAQPPAPTKEQIVRWVAELGDNDFATREQASKRLWEAGRAAERALASAARSDDAEVARRAQAVLTRFRWGLYPDTPPKVVEVVNRYRASDPAGKERVVRELFDLGGAGAATLLRIARAEEDAATKDRLFARVVQEVHKAAPALITEGRFDTLEEMLELGLAAESEGALAGYVAFVVLRGRADAAVDRYRAEADGAFGRGAHVVLAALHRARGDLVAARAAAEKARRPDLLEAILTDLADWKALAARPEPEGGSDGAEELGYRAAFQRLAGDAAAAEKTLKRLREGNGARAGGDEGLWQAAKALLLNDRPADGLALLAASKSHTAVTAEVYAAQNRFREALALSEDGPDRPALDVLRARLLFTVGERDKARGLFAELASRIRQGEETRWQEQLVETEARLGLKSAAREHCAAVLSAGKSPDRPAILLEQVFPGKGTSAGALWKHLRAWNKDEDANETLRKVGDFVEGRVAEKELADLAAEAWTRGDMPAGDRESLLLALADAGFAARREAPARSFLEKAVALGHSRAPQQRLGDDLAARGQWSGAAARYAAAWERDRSDPLPLYLRGHALVRAGRDEEGRRLTDAARLLPLGNEAVRHAFAEALARRGHADAARRERDLLMTTGSARSYYAGDATRHAALDAYSRKDYLKAAELHERAMLRCLSAAVGFVDNGAYVAIPHFVHRHRARALVAAGRFDEAKRHVAFCRALMPGDVDLPILLVPELEKTGRMAEADALFGAAYAFHEGVCREYPRCAWSRNALAWLSVCCRRRLDEALTHARRAVELAPDNASYHDTLGEVCFQRGDREGALTHARKAVELAPKRFYFRKQLKRIEGGDPKAELPPEGDGE